MAAVDETSTGTGAYGDVGQHCAIRTCRQLDFLPFRCASCAETFCLSHRSFADHACPQSGLGDRVAPACPACDEPVSLLSASGGHRLTPDQAVDAHLAAGCPSHEDKQRQRRCRARRCEDVPVVPFVCSTCHDSFCATHRFAETHACDARVRRKARKAAERRQRAADKRRSSAEAQQQQQQQHVEQQQQQQQHVVVGFLRTMVTAGGR